SVASGADALFSFLPAPWPPAKLATAMLAVGMLILLNLRGIRESVLPLVPVFLTFVLTHVAFIAYAVAANTGALPAVVAAAGTETQRSMADIGVFGTLVILLRAFTLGGGTFTGIEAVSNGLPILREPRVETARLTMRYMAVSLAFTASGLLMAYLLAGIAREP